MWLQRIDKVNKRVKMLTQSIRAISDEGVRHMERLFLTVIITHFFAVKYRENVRVTRNNENGQN